MVHFTNHTDQAAETTEQVDRVGDRQDIKERVADIGSESEAL
jgi:hypothetical protein